MTKSTQFTPRYLKILDASTGEILNLERLNIISLIPYCFLYSSQMSNAFSSLIPRISESLSGSFSIISKVLSLNFSTILVAVEGPTPLIAPLERNFKTCNEFCGIVASAASTLNCLP